MTARRNAGSTRSRAETRDDNYGDEDYSVFEKFGNQLVRAALEPKISAVDLIRRELDKLTDRRMSDSLTDAEQQRYDRLCALQVRLMQRNRSARSARSRPPR